jgi:hypothetical protein
MQRKLFFVYGVAAHAMFLGVYAWMAAFVGNFGFGLIPTIDGPRTGLTRCGGDDRRAADRAVRRAALGHGPADVQTLVDAVRPAAH